VLLSVVWLLVLLLGKGIVALLGRRQSFSREIK